MIMYLSFDDFSLTYYETLKFNRELALVMCEFEHSVTSVV